MQANRFNRALLGLIIPDWNFCSAGYNKAMNVAVLGAGAWGTALAKMLAETGHKVRLWTRHPEHVSSIAAKGTNERYLPGIRLPGALALENNINLAWGDCELVVVAVPSKALREVSEALSGFAGVVVSVTKGIEYDSGLTMCGVLAQTALRAKRDRKSTRLNSSHTV